MISSNLTGRMPLPISD